MERAIAVIVVSEAFSALWPDLAAQEDGTVRIGASEAEVAPIDNVAGAVIAAGGVEAEAIEVLQRLLELTSAPVVVVGAAADHRIAIALMRAGASDYFALPEDIDALRGWIGDRITRARAIEQAGEIAAHNRVQFDFSNMIGANPEIKAALRRASKVIERDASSVLIAGESGTGKGLLAQMIHYNSPRASRPIVHVRCSGMSSNQLESELFGYEKGAFDGAGAAKPGLFEAVRGGTLVLDDVDAIPIDFQTKLLHAIEAREIRRLGGIRAVPIDVRVIACTQIDLARAVRSGAFREDLYHKLSRIPIHLPPLRERGNDVLQLARAFMEAAAEKHRMQARPMSPDVRSALLSHRWTGNVRELHGVIERAMVLGDGIIHRRDLFESDKPVTTPSPIPFPATMNDIETVAAREMVERFGGNKAAAANALGISRSRLYRLIGESKDEV